MNKNLARLFKRKKILVTGGTGSIGSEIVRQLLTYEPGQIRIYSRDESKHFFLQQQLHDDFSSGRLRSLIGDVRDKERLDRAMYGVDIVFHAAALKHVPYCEYNPFEAVKTNVTGTQNVIDLAMKHHIERVVAISTDKAVYPNTVMGITKLLMERMMTSSHHYLGDAPTKFSVVRFGNVLHSRGSVIPTWIDQIKAGKPVTVTDKRMKRFFMSIPEAVNLVFTAMEHMKGQEVFVLKMEEQSIYKLARKVIKENSNGKKVSIEFTGLREKEKLTELLFTKEEREHMLENDLFYIILPEDKRMKQQNYSYESFKPVLKKKRKKYTKRSLAAQDL